MSSSKKRRELAKANFARQSAECRAGGAESLAHMWEAGCMKYDEQLKAVLEQNRVLECKVEELQAEIDRLMLEYCPEEMSEEQLRIFAQNQSPVPLDKEIAIERWRRG